MLAIGSAQLFGGKILVLESNNDGYGRVVQDVTIPTGVYTLTIVCNSNYQPDKLNIPEFFRKVPSSATDPVKSSWTSKQLDDGLYEHKRALTFNQLISATISFGALNNLPIEFHMLSLKNSSNIEMLNNPEFVTNSAWRSDGGKISYKNKPANPNYVAMYYFSGNSEDASGNDKHLSASNVSYGTGRNNETNSAAVFNGNDSQLKINDSIFNDLDQFTVTFWVKFNSFRGMPNEWSTLIGGKASLMADKNRIVFFPDNYASDGQLMTGNHLFNTGLWYKIELIKDSSQFMIAVNDTVVAQNWDRPDKPDGKIDSRSDFFGYFGVGNGGYTLDGSIDEILISKHAKLFQPPTISSFSSSATLDEGERLNLTVLASGSGNLSYKWFKNNIVIPGAASANYTVASVNESHQGNYKVEVSNSAGQQTSSSIMITINPDTDNDGLLDRLEIQLGSNINKIDTDDDGLGDYQEYYTYKTMLNNPDTDGDGLDDGDEVSNGFNPLVTDASSDGALFINRAVALEFFTLESNRYQLQYSSDLTNWTNEGAPFTGVRGYSKIYRDADSSPQYWRLKSLN